MSDEIDTKHYTKLLEAKRAEIEALMATGKDGSKPVELDQTTVGRLSRMDAMQVQAMAVAEKERRKQMLVRIEQAFSRIRDDEFGYCVTCDEPISSKRLELDPTVVTCIGCAQK